MIQVSGLEFGYPKTGFHLSIPDLEVGAGQSAALIGPSGCGKTTLLQLLAGIIPLQKGSIQIATTSLNQLPDRERRLFRIQTIGFIFQDFGLLDYLSVFDNMVHPYRINHGLMLTKEIKERAQSLATSVGLADKLQRFPKQLSQGEKQRVALCRALITKPRLILADEPTANLNPEQKHEILDLLLEDVKTKGSSLMLATHDYDLLDKFNQVIDFKDLLNNKATESKLPTLAHTL